jgi:hypothetical protein
MTTQIRHLSPTPVLKAPSPAQRMPQDARNGIGSTSWTQNFCCREGPGHDDRPGALVAVKQTGAMLSRLRPCRRAQHVKESMQ